MLHICLYNFNIIDSIFIHNKWDTSIHVDRLCTNK